jgi:hypothetical protein
VITLLVGVGCAVVGAVHSLSLARGVEGRAAVLTFVPRLLAVGGALVVAALLGHPIAGVLGWASGFAVGAFVAVRRMK